jgi:DNA replication protein
VAYQATLQGHDVRYLEADSIFARYALDSGADQERQLRPLLNADLVVLDDLFLARRISDSAGEWLQTLIHQRYKLRRSIVVTSNRRGTGLGQIPGRQHDGHHHSRSIDAPIAFA